MDFKHNNKYNEGKGKCNKKDKNTFSKNTAKGVRRKMNVINGKKDIINLPENFKTDKSKIKPKSKSKSNYKSQTYFKYNAIHI